MKSGKSFLFYSYYLTVPSFLFVSVSVVLPFKNCNKNMGCALTLFMVQIIVRLRYEQEAG